MGLPWTRHGLHVDLMWDVRVMGSMGGHRTLGETTFGSLVSKCRKWSALTTMCIIVIVASEKFDSERFGEFQIMRQHFSLTVYA